MTVEPTALDEVLPSLAGTVCFEDETISTLHVCMEPSLAAEQTE